MSGLLKAGATSVAVLELACKSPMKDGPNNPPPSPLAQALEVAELEIKLLQDALASQREEALRAEAVALETGRREGRNAAEDGNDVRNQKLSENLNAVRREWDNRLASLEMLAAMLAREVLAKVFLETTDLAELVDRAIQCRIATLRREVIVAIRVSGRDFPDGAALQGLAKRCDVNAALCIADPALNAGDCRFDLKLGHIDIGAATQWREIDAFLTSLANQAEAA